MNNYFCYGCNEEKSDSIYALLFTPPNMLGARIEFHLCQSCYKTIMKPWNEKRMQRAIDERQNKKK